ncbi:hypothetical protein D3C78_1484050 [compost metagenome]
MPRGNCVDFVQAEQRAPQPDQRPLLLQPGTGCTGLGDQRANLQLAERQQQLVAATARPGNLLEQARAYFSVLFAGFEDMPHPRLKVARLCVVFTQGA